MKKNIFDKFQDWLVATLEKFEKREDKDVLKKVLFWLILFFPYGIYLLLFKTKIKKVFKVLIMLASILLTIIGFDIALNPNRVYNTTCKESYTQFVLENEDLNLNEPLYTSKTSHFKVNDDLFFGFNIYDNFNMYYGIFKINDFHNKYELMSLYEVDFNFKNIYCNGYFKEVKEVHPVIVSFILSTQSNLDLKSIKSKTAVDDGDIFFNTIKQEVSIHDKTYIFELNDFYITKIIQKDSNEVLFEDSSMQIFSYYIPQVVKNLLQKHIGESYSILGYNYYDNAHYYNIDVAGEYYAVKYLPGVKANLLIIDDMNDFKENFIFAN